LLEILLQPAYRQTIQTTSPHILRYLAVAAILSKSRRRESMKDIISLIQQESYNYRDPLTQFVEALYINFDFDGAQKTLRECEKVMEYDFFLEGILELFFNNARHLIFETYCKIHQRIDLASLAQKLNMEREEAEKWIVDLIRNAQLDAKIDSANVRYAFPSFSFCLLVSHLSFLMCCYKECCDASAEDPECVPAGD